MRVDHYLLTFVSHFFFLQKNLCFLLVAVFCLHDEGTANLIDSFFQKNIYKSLNKIFIWFSDKEAHSQSHQASDERLHGLVSTGTPKNC
jgi:hypothetical protein